MNGWYRGMTVKSLPGHVSVTLHVSRSVSAPVPHSPAPSEHSLALNLWLPTPQVRLQAPQGCQSSQDPHGHARSWADNAEVASRTYVNEQYGVGVVTALVFQPQQHFQTFDSEYVHLFYATYWRSCTMSYLSEKSIQSFTTLFFIYKLLI